MSQILRVLPRRRVAAAVIGVLASANLASADGPSTAADRPEQEWIHVIPGECSRYMVLPAGAGEPIVEWEQALSLAACVQVGPAVTVRDPEQLEAVVEEMTRYLELPMMIYLQALAEGPAPIQLRAAFHIGLAYVALSTRARGSIAAPPDLATNAAAAARYRALHGRLEPLLVRSRRAAWVSFAAIGEAVADNPALASDAVARHMIRSAREMLPGLRDAAQLRSLWSLHRD